MIDFLNKYGLSKEDILEIKGHFDEKFIYNLGVMKIMWLRSLIIYKV